jgi:hypothetical protein
MARPPPRDPDPRADDASALAKPGRACAQLVRLAELATLPSESPFSRSQNRVGRARTIFVETRRFRLARIEDPEFNAKSQRRGGAKRPGIQTPGFFLRLCVCLGPGRDGPFEPPPGQNPASGFPAPGSHLGSTGQLAAWSASLSLAVRSAACAWARLAGPEPGARFVKRISPWPRPVPPSTRRALPTSSPTSPVPCPRPTPRSAGLRSVALHLPVAACRSPQAARLLRGLPVPVHLVEPVDVDTLQRAIEAPAE